MAGLFVAFLFGSLGGVVCAVIYQWTLTNKLLRLETAMLDLHERLVIEMKKRASYSAKGKQDFDEAVIAAAAKAKPPEPAKPWWVPMGTHQ